MTKTETLIVICFVSCPFCKAKKGEHCVSKCRSSHRHDKRYRPYWDPEHKPNLKYKPVYFKELYTAYESRRRKYEAVKNA